MSEEDKTEVYLNEQAEKFSERSEIPKADILADLRNLMVEGYSKEGARARWMSTHKRELGRGEAKDFIIRVIGKGTPQKGDYGEYAYMEFLIQDDGILETKTCSFSESAFPKMDMLHLNKTYKVRAFERSKDGQLNRLRAIEEISDDKIPQVQQLSAYDFPFPELSDLENCCLGKTKLYHGWVGEIRHSRQDGEMTGFEFGDDNTMVAPFIFVKYAHDEVKEVMQEVQDGDELYVCAYMTKGDRGITGRAKGVFKIE